MMDVAINLIWYMAKLQVFPSYTPFKAHVPLCIACIVHLAALIRLIIQLGSFQTQLLGRFKICALSHVARD